MENPYLPLDLSAKQEELEAIQDAKSEEALGFLVRGKTPEDVIFERPARGGKNVPFVPGWWFIEQLNALFGWNWDFEVLDQKVEGDQVWVKGKLTIHGRGGAEISKTQFGGSDVKKYAQDQQTKSGMIAHKRGEVIDLGDDLKAAATDALKKCATLLGIARDVYGKREKLEEGAADREQLKAYKSLPAKAGVDPDKYARDKYGKGPEELEALIVLGLIGDLRKEIAGKGTK